MQLANFSHPLLQQRTISAWQTNCNNFRTYGRKDNILARLKMFFFVQRDSRGYHSLRRVCRRKVCYSFLLLLEV